MMGLFEQILKARGLDDLEQRQTFLKPSYDDGYDPFLLPDMAKAVDRLVQAHDNQQRITIYGDYDIDGLTATTVLLDAFESFGFQNIETFIPNRFVEGYGLTVDAVEKIAASGAELIITVDCGSLSEKEILRASELGVDVIVTDHHNVAPVQPPAVAVINPKRLLQDYPEAYDGFVLKQDFPPTLDLAGTEASTAHISQVTVSASESRDKSRESDAAQPERIMTGEMATTDASANVSSSLSTTSQLPTTALYPFLDLPGVGVAFKLVQALQTKLDGLETGQEKWLLDLVALGTVCDVVRLEDENRTHVYWGLEVLKKARRPGIRALMAVSGVEPHNVTARSLGFGLGPRMNASGRLDTAESTLQLLRTTDPLQALEKARLLDDMNAERRSKQDAIFKQALIQAETYKNDPVLVVSSPGWSHGIIGIVAAKLLEKYKKPTYVLEEMGDESKGSARSYGDFSAADAIRASDDIINKGGGHKLAAGVTLPTKNIAAFRERVNQHFHSLKLAPQPPLLLAKEDVAIDNFQSVTEEFVAQVAQLEPFGSANPEPVLKIPDVIVKAQRKMGADQQHLKIAVQDKHAQTIEMLAFNADPKWFVQPGERVTVWFVPSVNEWRGRRSVEGKLLYLTKTSL